MRIYLDNCSLQRPLDNQTQSRIEQETKAVIEILTLCETGSLTIISSDVLQLEIDAISDLERRETALGILRIAEENVQTDSEIENRAQNLVKTGIKPLDALHLASAEAGKADYFCTCDDKLLKKAKAKSDLKLKAISPLELIKEILK